MTQSNSKTNSDTNGRIRLILIKLTETDMKNLKTLSLTKLAEDS